jgi:fructuronate reductase
VSRALAGDDSETWLSSLSTVTTMVDRITPRTSPDDSRAVEEATGRSDLAPVATEPVHEWVLSGDFMAGRPQWQHSGATFTDDILPFEHRKLWLLGGGHSLLACAGSIRGHGTVAAAVADDTCRSWLQQWWAEASAYIDLPPDDVDAYRAALLERCQPADPAPAGPDRHPRLAEAAGTDPADTAAGTGAGPHATGRAPSGCSLPGCAR